MSLLLEPRGRGSREVDFVRYTCKGTLSRIRLKSRKGPLGRFGVNMCSFACRYCQVTVPRELLEDLLPGPVTLVMERSEELNKDLNPFTPVSQI